MKILSATELTLEICVLSFVYETIKLKKKMVLLITHYKISPFGFL